MTNFSCRFSTASQVLSSDTLGFKDSCGAWLHSSLTDCSSPLPAPPPFKQISLLGLPRLVLRTVLLSTHMCSPDELIHPGHDTPFLASRFRTLATYRTFPLRLQTYQGQSQDTDSLPKSLLNPSPPQSWNHHLSSCLG